LTLAVNSLIRILKREDRDPRNPGVDTSSKIRLMRTLSKGALQDEGRSIGLAHVQLISISKFPREQKVLQQAYTRHKPTDMMETTRRQTRHPMLLLVCPVRRLVQLKTGTSEMAMSLNKLNEVREMNNVRQSSHP